MQVVRDDFRCIFRLDLVQRIWKIPLSLDDLSRYMHWAAFDTIDEKVRVLFRDDALNVSFHVPRDSQLDTILVPTPKMDTLFE
jgi:hypothetical protein